jgi:hypothetical protein
VIDLKRKLTREIEKQEQKILGLRTQLAEEEGYLRSQLDMLKLLPRNGGGNGSAPALRPNSDLARARDVIRAAGKPVHITEILQKLGKELTRDNRSSLSGSIGWYVRRDEIFTRPLPNTFGLAEFEKPEQAEEEPPDGFGLDEKKEEKAET